MIYLDNAATAFPKAPGTTECLVEFLENAAGNPGRGGHRLTVAASRAIENARQSIADLLGGDPEHTLLGSGATFWLNTVLSSRLKAGDRVVITALEHNAVMRPLSRFRTSLGLEVAVVPGSETTGVPSVAEVKEAVSKAPTALVILNHASNVTGAVVEVEQIARAVAPVPVVVDGAQTAGCLAFDFKSSELAAFACSGHKGLLGPGGTGVLMISPDFSVEALIRGGTGSRSESDEMPEHLPDRLEAGTPNGPGIVGLGESCRWLAEHGVEVVAAHEHRLRTRLVEGLHGVQGIHVVGNPVSGRTTGTVSFVSDGVDTGELATRLDREWHVCLRAGLHCAPAAHQRLGTFPAGTIRASVGPFTKDADVETLVAALGTISR